MSRARARISSLGRYLPERVMTNAELEKFVDTNDQWIRTRTGIHTRHIAAPGEVTSHMATRAARECLERRGIGADEIDLIIVATVTPDMPFPATACLVQDQLGAKRAWAFDLQAACSGFVYAFTVGAQFIESGAHKKVLVIGADTMSSILNYKDRTTCVLFGDGAGAVLLEPSTDGTGLLAFTHEADGSGGCHLRMQAGGSLMPATHETVDKGLHFIEQDGQHVFKYAVRKMAEVSLKVLEQVALPASEVALFVPHQANIRIIDAAQQRLGLPDERVIKNIAQYGNTTAATVPLALATALDEGRLKQNDLVLLASVGAGFTVGAVALRWTSFPW